MLLAGGLVIWSCQASPAAPTTVSSSAPATVTAAATPGTADTIGTDVPVPETPPAGWTDAHVASLAESEGISTTEAIHRLNIEDRTDALGEEVMNRPDDFAGAFYTVGPGDYKLTIRTIAGNDKTSTIKANIPAGDPIVFIPAKYSWAKLLATSDALGKYAASGQISSFGADAESNTVKVTFTKDDPQLQAELSATYGDLVSFDTAVRPMGVPIP